MRALGALNMSVGTSLAFEKDANDVMQETNSLLVNLRTLVRNVMQSYDKSDELIKDDIIKDTKSDLTELARWLTNTVTKRSLAFVVYYPTYKSLPSIYSKADLVSKDTRTPKAKAFNDMLESVCAELLKQFPKQIVKTDTQLPKFDGKGVIITHHVVDLTMTTGITRLKVLESYTGTVKPYTLWYTKLTGGKELYYMPFNKLSIQVFGDKAINFYSSKLALKKIVEELATSKNWTAGTSYSKVRSDINGLPSSITKAGLKLLL